MKKGPSMVQDSPLSLRWVRLRLVRRNTTRAIIAAMFITPTITTAVQKFLSSG